MVPVGRNVQCDHVFGIFVHMMQWLLEERGPFTNFNRMASQVTAVRFREVQALVQQVSQQHFEADDDSSSDYNLSDSSTDSDVDV